MHFSITDTIIDYLDVVDAFLVHGGVTTIRNETLGIFQFAKFVPHFSRIAHDNGHTRVNNDIILKVIEWTKKLSERVVSVGLVSSQGDKIMDQKSSLPERANW